jgi:hypothetical protein
LRRAGLEPDDLTDPDRRVPLIRYLELLEICADLLADKQFGLKFGTQYEPKHAGVVGNVALASRTVGETFKSIGRYLPTMVDATVHGVDFTAGRSLSAPPTASRKTSSPMACKISFLALDCTDRRSASAVAPDNE